MTAQRILLVVACLALAACAGGGASPTPSPAATSAASPAPSAGAIVLRETPADLGCDSIGIDYTSMTFHIDPTAPEPVSAMTDTGVSLETSWPPDFTAGEGVVRDTTGAVVVTDGDKLQVGQDLHGYGVCLGPTALWVMLSGSGG
jgi:hypothetical protein